MVVKSIDLNLIHDQKIKTKGSPDGELKRYSILIYEKAGELEIKFVYIHICRPMFTFVESFIQLDVNLNEP